MPLPEENSKRKNTGSMIAGPAETARAGRPIKVGQTLLRIAITPNGQTVYALGLDGMTPISTATDVAGPLIRTGGTITGVSRSFTHELIRQTLLAGLSTIRRQRLHARVECRDDHATYAGSRAAMNIIHFAAVCGYGHGLDGV